MSPPVVSCHVNIFLIKNFGHVLYIVNLFVLHVNHVALKIFFEYFRKIKQDSRVLWLSGRFDLIALIASSLALSELLESQETFRDEIDYPTSFNSISLHQMVATPARIYTSY